MVSHPREYRWSSYRPTAGLHRPPEFLTTDWIFAQFGTRKKEAQKRYRAFVAQGIDGRSPFDEVAEGCILGSEQFIHAVWERHSESEEMKEVPRSERMIGRPSLRDLFDDTEGREERDQTIRLAVERCGYPAAEVARHLGLHYSLISKILNRMKNSRFKTGP